MGNIYNTLAEFRKFRVTTRFLSKNFQNGTSTECDVQGLGVQQYFSSMISTEIITATLAREEAILYIESHRKVIYGIETMALVKYTHVICAPQSTP